MPQVELDKQPALYRVIERPNQGSFGAEAGAIENENNIEPEVVGKGENGQGNIYHPKFRLLFICCNV